MGEKIIIGEFGQSYGVKGWLKVNSFTDPPENILNYLPWQTQNNNQWFLIEVTHSQKQTHQIIVKLAECDSPEFAKTYTKRPIAIERNQLPVLKKEEFYWSDLIGLTVINLQGIQLGTVEHLLATGSNDVLIVQSERKRLIPYTSTAIVKVDLANKMITVDWDADF